ncbi:ankyrin repeat and IBR domain-containing protein 1-like isoform X2 [Ostrea edulis]|uniref:ankyrin repeat and IBR domain-containing protein 1-like isoform X2 n=1 Tax=Ostrea edulis TaxID=37623 RepID=UPI0024AF50DD|nr:ankyrin repeat and IBR domain-containing protein 1-like isoform X2 [Ostrea edulis]
MGSSSSKFRKHLSNGDEVAALHLYNSNSDLRKGLDPNCSYGDHHNHETPLHYASKHSMKSLLSGNPNKTNGKKETSLTCVCMEKAENAQFYPVQKKRLDCLLILLKWRGPETEDGERERVDLGSQDENDNTALHYAALSGLKYCVEKLVQSGAPLFTENKERQTPCDCAEEGGHAEIALYLESKMVFSSVGNDDDETEDVASIMEPEEYSGLRAQDLQEAKDQLLVETADMLSVPLFTAEALLRNHEWSREMLLEAWMSDPLQCCDKSGVHPPASVFCEKPVVQQSLDTDQHRPETQNSTGVCDICMETFVMSDDHVHMICDHMFCRECWKEYLNLKIQEGDAHNITCPAYQCDKLAPVELIESVVSRDMARRYLQFDIKAFVDSNPNIKWCPFPGCGRAVRLPDQEERNKKIPVDTSRAVDCGNGHYFCWDCLGEAHEPSSCDNWNKWFQKISEIKPEEMCGTEEETNTAANCLWLVTNSKPCPNCKSPIQKNEGCNHMKCSKCKHDFCWVCLDQWKRHNTSTGGYFKCNRYEAVKVVQEETQKAQVEAEEQNVKMQELNKFVHFYTRFKNHENSYKLEEPLLNTTKNKMMKLAEAVTDLASANSETQFVEHAVQQLLKGRRVLKCSYVYGYYLDGPGYMKIVFEFMQTELEETTEILSQMVNRLYLRTPKKRIIEQAQLVQRKRHEFILAISKGLVPPETPPGLRKHRRRKYSMETEDEQLRKAILASIQEVDPAKPWIKDASGRHTNVMAVLDWPNSDDSDTEDLYTVTDGRCQKMSCNNPRAKNPRTGETHEYCSRQCMYEDKLENPEQPEPVQEVIMDEQMDLLRALEMSRLQYLHDQGIITADRSSISIQMPPEEAMASVEDAVRQRSPRSQRKSPKQKSPGVRGKGKGKKTIQAALEELDVELQRVLEISSISPTELQETVRSDQKAQEKGAVKQRSRFDDMGALCVQSIPNRSVEDLDHDDCINCNFAVDPERRNSNEDQPPTTPRSSFWHFSDGMGDHFPVFSPTKPTSPQRTSSNSSPQRTSSNSCFGIIKDINVSNLHTGESDKIIDMEEKNLVLLASTKVPEDTDLLATLPGPPGYNSQTQQPRRDQSYSSKNNFGLLAANTPGDEHVLLLQSPETPEHIALGYPGQSCTRGAVSRNYTDVHVHIGNSSESDSEHDACHKFLSSLKPPSDGFLDSLTVCNNETKPNKLTPPQALTLPSEKLMDCDTPLVVEASAQLDSSMDTWATKCQGEIHNEAQNFSAEGEDIAVSSHSKGNTYMSPVGSVGLNEGMHAPTDQSISPENKDILQLLDVEDVLEFEDSAPPSGNIGEDDESEGGDNSVYV